MNISQLIRDASANGYSNWEILAMVVEAGYDFLDAVWKVSQVLRLPIEEVQEMERNYDKCC